MKYLLVIFLTMFSLTAFSVSDQARYMELTRKNDTIYERVAEGVIGSNNWYHSHCWKNLSPLSIELFYTINTEGKAQNIVTFPKEIDTTCIKKRLLSLEYPAPKSTFYGWMLIWDGSGG